MALDTLPLSIDFLAQVDVDGPADASGSWVPLPDVADFVFRISATRNGPAIGGLTAAAAFRSGVTNRYYAVFDRAALVAELTEFLGQIVYVILSRDGDANDIWHPLRVVDHHEMAVA